MFSLTISLNTSTEAKGLHRYAGSFINGLPDGKGVYYFSDENYFSGNFQQGIQEGKGEMHYRAKFDLYEISPSSQIGNSITFEIATTSGSPDGTKGNFTNSSGYVLTITSVISVNGARIQKLSDFSSANKYSVTYELTQFPVSLFATLSNGSTFNLELYKAATWTARLYVNK